VVAFARKYDVMICHDAGYTEMAFDGYRAPSFLQAKGAKEVHTKGSTYPFRIRKRL